jgi:hypothetical protein
MAKAANDAKGFFSSNPIIIARFCGITPNSSTTFKLVQSICIQLQAVSNFYFYFLDFFWFLTLKIFPHSKLEVPTEYRQIVKVFPNWLGLATPERPISLLN